MTALPSPLDQPIFILLEDLENGSANLFERPRHAITATTIGDVPHAMSQADALASADQAVAGWIGYEAGYALEPRLHRHLDHGGANGALLRLFSFDAPATMAVDAVDGWLGRRSADSAGLGPLRPAISFEQYADSFHRVKDAIAAGEIYQANLTFPLRGAWQGDPVAIYRAIRPEAKARFAALLFDGVDWLLSFSPELFFVLQDRDIKARPMKGTRPRGTDEESDQRYARELAASEKDRAENLMIVDLMRNDLSRLSVPGSVTVESLFRIEAYPTIFQMTTGISARLDRAPSFTRAFGALFPCGSITGAPKIRAMEIIHQVEHWTRGPYCGAIGEIHGAAGGDGTWRCRFNVAIRTLRLQTDASGSGGSAEFGVGSGIVADSVLEDEWAECLLKAAFIERGLANIG